ncbi:MAG: disulfide bond formation protein B [Leptothrix sp. (in: b-proteobacteria)]
MTSSLPASRPGQPGAAPRLLFGAWLVALSATLGALFLGEVMGRTPCVLCWYQRIAMFPLAVILLVGQMPFDRRCLRYALPLVALGGLIAAYHALLYAGVIPADLMPCGACASCSNADLQRIGGVPIPHLSLLAFGLIGALLGLTHRDTQRKTLNR